MGTAIAVLRDYSSRELRRLATRVKDARQARRLLAIAAVLDDGSSREEEAAGIGGMESRHQAHPIRRSDAWMRHDTLTKIAPF